MKSDTYPKPYAKINSKLTKDLSLTAKTIKLFEENTGENHYGIGFGSDFMDTTVKANNKIKKKDKWTSSKLRHFVHQRRLLRKQKYSLLRRKNICKSYSDKGLISRINKEDLKFNNKITNNSKNRERRSSLVVQWVKDLTLSLQQLWLLL